ncbi:protein serine/threonine kinase, putative [Entamoeba invadens IP1]|uniref:Protein serine/threonine kinase, putative n=1 Tax=Entamoeba invadens IP1 TaxID=370355 RepID=L7FNB4_ENTIV|nr:protein serine/threonine kinase, putative [Entamoeba invadens IP1]ELP92950.1 protein serine/threonine kinase, putative [Entamoeba invadens IP1]|eukprot:XP_004259721.1 protein serine/threonine kinase, putative [Entamoeba invadens IP1]
MTINGDCQPFSQLEELCEEKVTQNGCAKCKNGYYRINGNECKKCNSNCFTCSIEKVCTSCYANHLLNENNICKNVSEVSNCVRIENSKCEKCVFWYTPSKNGMYCQEAIIWWVILIIVLFIIFVTIFLVNGIVLASKFIEKKTKQQLTTQTTVFKMSHSNISFVSIGHGLVVNKTLILFGDLEHLIKVGVDTCELICVGNSSKHHLKIQFSTKENNERLTIKTIPQVVSLLRGQAVEVEIHIHPNCSCKIHDIIALFTKNLKNGITKEYAINLNIITEISTRLDPDELVAEKKLGEGSFGIVYKGNFRGNVVAIKKMKEFKEIDNEMDEFIKEVAMLDKFRSEFIVYFYGAVFIPTKVCLVTEFAHYGSLQDSIKHKTGDEVNIDMRIKIMLDASKGISYLHDNGILHRDIKPDNILVFSFNLNDKINAKLTDFGSSRNINLLMTNMTFTKGVGTPSYMAPEIVIKEKYTKSADIYSFAITMFEAFSWKEAYLIKDFKFPWKIAEFVTAGKRLKRRKKHSRNIF